MPGAIKLPASALFIVISFYYLNFVKLLPKSAKLSVGSCHTEDSELVHGSRIAELKVE